MCSDVILVTYIFQMNLHLLIHTFFFFLPLPFCTMSLMIAFIFPFKVLHIQGLFFGLDFLPNHVI